MDRIRKDCIELGDPGPERKKKKIKHMFFLICGPSSNSSELSVQHGETTETRNI